MRFITGTTTCDVRRWWRPAATFQIYPANRFGRVAGHLADRYHGNYYTNPISSGNISKVEDAEIISRSGIPRLSPYTPLNWHAATTTDTVPI